MAERPTPLSLAVCILIALQSDKSSPLYKLELDEAAKEEIIEALQNSMERGWTNGIQGLLRSIHAKAGSAVSSLLLECLQDVSTSIDALLDLMDSLQKSIKTNVIDGASPPGIYVRKTWLGFDELKFETMARLWEALKEEVEQVNLEEEVVEGAVDDQRWPMSPTQIETELLKQCLAMDKSDHSFEETELIVQRILVNDPDLPTAHFLRFLNCLRHGERVDALHALHKYFDFVRIREYRAMEEHKPDSKTRNGVLPYASIVLAALHHSFGEHSLSLKATEEAVRVAQESNDTACVAYALGWLYMNRPDFDVEELLRKCSARAGEVRTLAAGAQLSLAEHFLTSNGPVSRAWESIYSASAPGVIDTSSTTMTLDRPAQVTSATTSEDAMIVLAKQALVGAGVWEACGLPMLSKLSSQVALQSYSEGMSRQDKSLAIQNIARVALYGPSEGSSCRYASALRSMAKSGSLSDPNGPVAGVALVLHEWAVRRGDLPHAEYLTSVLHSSLHSRIPNHSEAVVDILSQRSLLLMRQEQWQKAIQLTKYICSVCQKEGMRTQHAFHLIRLASIQLESNANEIIGALSPLLECLSMCERLSIDSYHAAALSVLAQVHLRLGDTGKAMSVIQAPLPLLVQQMHSSFAAEAYLTLAKCHLRRAKQRASKDRDATIHILRSACTNLEKARQLFHEIHDLMRLKEIYYLLAVTYNSIPDHEDRRDEASSQFLKASKQLEISRHGGNQDTPWGSLKDVEYIEKLASRQLEIEL
jgi:tetratricopeptide (TPR) repeat protein